MDMSSDAFNLLRDYIRTVCGLVITEDKEYFIRQRLEPLAERMNCRSMDEFVHRLRFEPSFGLRAEVISAITTNETSFFRDGHPWDAIRNVILPELAKRARHIPTSERKFRFWSAASATGQEAFSLAILVDEFTHTHPEYLLRNEHFSILATDISQRMIVRSLSGYFSAFELTRGLSQDRKHKYFINNGSHYTASDNLRGMIEFREANLTSSLSSLGTFDLILCRNVLIYLDAATKTAIFSELDTMLATNGWLMLGATENVYGLTDLFVSERHGSTILYRKKNSHGGDSFI